MEFLAEHDVLAPCIPFHNFIQRNCGSNGCQSMQELYIYVKKASKLIGKLPLAKKSIGNSCVYSFYTIMKDGCKSYTVTGAWKK